MKKFVIKLFYTLLFSVIFLALFSQCKKTPTEPKKDEETNCNYEPGNRNFTWRMDTVALFPSWMGSIWAFSDNDAYLMGNIFQRTNGVSLGYLGLHWNGTEWSTEINGTIEEIKHYANDVTGDDHFLVSSGYWSISAPKAALGEFNNLTKKWNGFQFQTEGQLYSVWTDKKGYYIAVGTNGMVYQKDGYAAEWVYSKAPTEFTFTKVTGISKSEIYCAAYLSLSSGYSYNQIWKFSKGNWIKLTDTQDTAGTYLKLPETELNDIAVEKCSSVDTVSLYVAGNGIFKFTSSGETLEFTKEVIATYEQSFGHICFISPIDFWVTDLKYNIYHWNGTDLMKIEPINNLPYGQLWGYARPIIKTNTGKIWMVLEMDSQVYSVLQGTP